MDSARLILQQPAMLALSAPLVLLCALAYWLGGRHSRATRWLALVLRSLAVIAICVLLAGPAVMTEQVRRVAPRGQWRLLLEGAAPREGVADFSESPAQFVARVRNALEDGTPPLRCEIFGGGQAARNARDAVAALGVDCDWTRPEADASAPVLHGIKAPRALQPGEPLAATLIATPGATVRVLLNGAETPARAKGGEWRIEVPGLEPGRHVIECELLGASGEVVQRAGQVVRVSPKPRLLLLGLSDARAAEAKALAPSYEIERCTALEFSAAHTSRAALVFAGVDALYALESVQAWALASFVARGGGLYASGDGARYVTPEFLPRDLEALLPVTLLSEPRPETPPTPPVVDRPVVSEIAKVSICYVLDRSGSMDAPIGAGGLTRWQVAVKGVTDSMAKLSVDARAAVMTFTLKQSWHTVNRRTGEPEPRVFLEGNRIAMEAELARLASDQVYDDVGFNTDIYAAMESAIRVMEGEPGAVKMIIMLTDGADRWATEAGGKRHSDLRDRAEGKGINIVSIGIGEAFAGDMPEALSARRVINDLATRTSRGARLAFMPSSAEDAARAHVIFVNSVETAFEMFDERKRREEEERRRLRQEQAEKEQEPPKVDSAAGIFALTLEPAGAALFGADALGALAPRLQWYARNQPRPGAAVALGIAADDPHRPAALALGAWGLGRVAFWAAGTHADALGEVAAWADFPALFAASLRWLTPREVPGAGVAGNASPAGIRIAETAPDAKYWLQTGGRRLDLELRQGLLAGQQAIPEGAYELFEEYRGQAQSLGDVYVAASPAVSRFEPGLEALALAATGPAEREVMLVVASESAILYLGLLLLILLPVERWVRRRT